MIVPKDQHYTCGDNLSQKNDFKAEQEHLSRKMSQV